MGSRNSGGGHPRSTLKDKGAGDKGADADQQDPTIIDLGTVQDPAADFFDKDDKTLSDKPEEEIFFQEPVPVIDKLPGEAANFPQPGDAGEEIISQSGDATEEIIVETVVPDTVFEEDGVKGTATGVEEDHGPKRAPRMNIQGNRRSYGHCFASAMDNPKSRKSYKGMQFFKSTVTELRDSGEMTGATKHAITWFLMTQMTAEA